MIDHRFVPLVGRGVVHLHGLEDGEAVVAAQSVDVPVQLNHARRRSVLDQISHYSNTSLRSAPPLPLRHLHLCFFMLAAIVQRSQSGSYRSTVSRLETPSKPPHTNSLSPTETAPTALQKTASIKNTSPHGSLVAYLRLQFMLATLLHCFVSASNTSTVLSRSVPL